jgi:RNA polymerase sigma-70 factor, ECF subfamily
MAVAEAAGRETAGRLFEQHSGRIYAYCLGQLGSREDAEDALQVTFLNAHRSLRGGFDPYASLAWLLRIAQNVCVSIIRSHARRGRVEQTAEVAGLAAWAPAPTEARDELIGLAPALATLPRRQLRAILLREWRGLSYREIGAELRLSQPAVEALIFRARRSLAASL